MNALACRNGNATGALSMLPRYLNCEIEICGPSERKEGEVPRRRMARVEHGNLCSTYRSNS